MIRNLKVLGLAVVAVCAMSAMMASAAQATPTWWFKSDAATGKKTTLTGVQIGENIFKTTAGDVKCEEAHFTGSAIGPTQTSVTLHPVYNKCTAFGFGATVDTTGCNYIFDNSTTKFVATTTIECEAGKEITVVAKLAGITKCTVHIGPQDVGGVALKNGASDIIAEVNLTAIAYTHTAGVGAGACISGGAANGSYTGGATVSGFNEAGGATAIEVG
jgi:hypothetical protein